MARRKRDSKTDSVRQHGCLHPRRGQVTDELFCSNEFFDPRDLVLVKYEMLRRVRVDGHSVSQSAARFGLSRPAYYQAQRAFETGGLPALLPRKPGLRGAHKLSDEVVQALREAMAADPQLRPPQLAKLLEDRFGLSVHRRSIERALSRPEKTPLSDDAWTRLTLSEKRIAVLTARYEALRDYAIGRNPDAVRHGIALLLREGMAAWTHVPCESATAPAPDTVPTSSVRGHSRSLPSATTAPKFNSYGRKSLICQAHIFGCGTTIRFLRNFRVVAAHHSGTSAGGKVVTIVDVALRPRGENRPQSPMATTFQDENCLGTVEVGTAEMVHVLAAMALQHAEEVRV